MDYNQHRTRVYSSGGTAYQGVFAGLGFMGLPYFIIGKGIHLKKNGCL
ncbi:hypothetical protein [uncultured Bacteroides sp.]|nr:hypothetical protein [uncultured Bacteroides sp.]